MSGLGLVMLSGLTTGGTGGVVIPGAMDWTNVSGDFSADTNLQTLSLITVPILIAATNSGSGTLYYRLNGGYAPYTGSFTVVAGDVLGWGVSGDGVHTKTGTITVQNGSNGFSTIDTFTYVVTR